MGLTLDAFVSKWSASSAAERANKDAFLLELCDLLDVPRPDATSGDPERDRYVFEKDARMPDEGGVVSVGKIDLYKEGCFVLEAKQGSDPTSKKLGTAKRNTPAWNVAMQGAYGQALGYAKSFDSPPPFVVTCDIGYCFDLYAAFDGSWNYRPFPNAQQHRIHLADLGKHTATLRRIFLDPRGLDPSKQAAKVTREVAAHLAELAKALEAAGHAPEGVATFLMRCLFTMFAEDVGLLPIEPESKQPLFTHALEKLWLPNPRAFPAGIEALWRAMNAGTDFGFVGKLLRFNGGLFSDPRALPLSREHLALLLEAAKCNWSDVEPAIFGTLLERALDAKERHALGAHYTPRAYVERLVRPTIEEPLRSDWELVQAEVRQLVAADKVDAAKRAVRAFHRKLCETRVLDPACGSGNFLYVTLDLFKRLEGEVLALLEGLGDKQTLLHADTIRVTPAQFLGIEVKRWAKEIAELVLWIGYLQHHVRAYGKAQPPPEPVLQDYKNIECRDAVLAWDSVELVRDERGKPVTRWDGETYKKSPVTGEDVPDESARVAVYKYVNPRKAEWPKADFIVGNPPFVGNKRMRLALGDGYVEALRSAYSDVPDTVDYVMYWWNRALTILTTKQSRYAGFIATNSLTQMFNRSVLQTGLASDSLSIRFAVPDHPWVDVARAAAVRIAMLVVGDEERVGVLAEVAKEEPGEDGAALVFDVSHGEIHADLSIGAPVLDAQSLRANQGLCRQGVKLVGPRDHDGFVVQRADLLAFGGPGGVIKPYVSNREIVQKRRDRYVIDFFGMAEAEARAANPAAYQRLFDIVRPFREQNRDAQRRRCWWLFGRSNVAMRISLDGLRRFIITPEVAKHRPFLFVPEGTITDASLYVIGSDDAFLLGVLSGRVHACWALAAGGHMGVGNDPRYQNGPCFDPYPFPVGEDDAQDRIRTLAESLDAHRKRQQALHPDLTLTGMYNVLAKLRSGEALSAKEKVIHEQGLVSVLKQLHDDLDAAVFDAYGWPHDLTDEQILERLVALNAERAEEERRGLVRWLRPDFQNPSGARGATQETLAGVEEDDGAEEAAPSAKAWPKKLPEQLAAVRELVTRASGGFAAKEVAKAFKGAKGKEVEPVLDALAALGIVVAYEAKGERRWRGARAAA